MPLFERRRGLVYRMPPELHRADYIVSSNVARETWMVTSATSGSHDGDRTTDRGVTEAVRSHDAVQAGLAAWMTGAVDAREAGARPS
jgi:hypothetical protein